MTTFSPVFPYICSVYYNYWHLVCSCKLTTKLEANCLMSSMESRNSYSTTRKPLIYGWICAGTHTHTHARPYIDMHAYIHYHLCVCPCVCIYGKHTVLHTWKTYMVFDWNDVITKYLVIGNVIISRSNAKRSRK